MLNLIIINKWKAKSRRTSKMLQFDNNKNLIFSWCLNEYYTCLLLKMQMLSMSWNGFWKDHGSYRIILCLTYNLLKLSISKLLMFVMFMVCPLMRYSNLQNIILMLQHIF